MSQPVSPGSRSRELFRNGRSQAVCIPREVELSGEEAILRKEGERLIIGPAPPRSLLAMLAALKLIDEGGNAGLLTASVDL